MNESINLKKQGDVSNILNSYLIHQIKDVFHPVMQIRSELKHIFLDTIFNQGNIENEKILNQLNLGKDKNPIAYLRSNLIISKSDKKRNTEIYNNIINSNKITDTKKALMSLNYSDLYNGNGETLDIAFNYLEQTIQITKESKDKTNKEMEIIRIHALQHLAWQETYHNYNYTDNTKQTQISEKGGELYSELLELIKEHDPSLRIKILNNLINGSSLSGRNRVHTFIQTTKEDIQKEIFEIFTHLIKTKDHKNDNIFRYEQDRILLSSYTNTIDQKTQNEMEEILFDIPNLFIERDKQLVLQYMGKGNSHELKDIEDVIRKNYTLIDQYYEKLLNTHTRP